jgi:hypothetical protein
VIVIDFYTRDKTETRASYVRFGRGTLLVLFWRQCSRLALIWCGHFLNFLPSFVNELKIFSGFAMVVGEYEWA